MARKGLYKKIQPPPGAVTADLVSRVQDNIRDAVETLASDHDVWTSPAINIVATGTIPPDAAIVAYRGGASQTLTLPPANAQGLSAGAQLVVMNLATVAVTLAPTKGDTINGSTSFSAPTNTATVLTSDGASAWQTPQVPPTVATNGRLLRTPQYLNSGTTITHPAGTALIRVRVIGGGGGGGGVAAAAASQTTLASGGGGGAYCERTYVAASLSSTYVIGAAGTGGISGGGAGVAGGNTTFTHNAVTVTAGGGGGGAFAASAATAAFLLGGAGGTPSGGTLNSGGTTGGYGIRPDAASPTVALSGGGGDGPLAGGGGVPAITTSAGQSGTGFGAGGGGALTVNGGTAKAGSDGNQGLIIVEEYS